MAMEWLTILGVVGGLVALLFGVHICGRRYQWHPEWQRKTLHVALGLTALTFPWLFSATWQVLVICALGTGVMLAVRLVPGLQRSVGASLHSVGRSSSGELLFALTIVLIFALAQGSFVAYVIPLAILTLADTAAALVGIHWGNHRFAVLDGEKSWEGVAVFALTAAGTASLLLRLLTPLPWSTLLVFAALLALIGACVEATAWQGLDNLLVPLAIYLALADLQQSSHAVLCQDLAGLLLAIGAVQLMPIRLLPHTALTASLVTYCVWSGGLLTWLPLLLLLLLAYTIIESRPTQKRLSQFDTVPMNYWLAWHGS